MEPEQTTENQQHEKKGKHNGSNAETFETPCEETEKVEIESLQKVQKPGLKKKVKHKGWDTNVKIPSFEVPKPLSQRFNIDISKIQKKQPRYKNISEMSAKYSFNIQAVLGSGFASTVYLGTRNDNQQLVCIKAIDLMTIGFGLHAGLIHQQIQSLKKFESDYIVKLYDVYESNTFIYLVMQLCPGGDLYKMLKLSPNNLPCKFVNDIIKQIAHGLKQIHDRQIIHRDMKTENIFVLKFPQNQNEQIKVKIGDLGFCVSLQELQKMKKMGRHPQNVGSPIYMSPEICEKSDYKFSSDIYSLGIIWYELYHKKAPWEALSQAELLNKKLKQEVKIWREDIRPQIKKTILKCINNDPQQRPNSTQLLKIIDDQLQTNPQKQIKKQ